MNRNPSDSRRVEKFIHLRIMRKNETLFAKPTMVADGNQKAVIRIDPG